MVRDPGVFSFRRVPLKVALAAICSTVAIAFLYAMWNEPAEEQAAAKPGRGSNTAASRAPARSTPPPPSHPSPPPQPPPPDPVETEKVLAFARIHIPAARRHGEAYNLFETGEASLRYRPAQKTEMSAAVLAQFRAAQPDRWKEIFGLFAASIEAAKVNPDSEKSDWSAVSPRVRVVPFRLLADALKKKEPLELDKGQKELALAWLREQNGNPEVRAFGGDCSLVFDSLKTFLAQESMQAAVPAEQAVKELKELKDPAAVNLLFEAMGIPSPRIAGEAADGLTWRLTPAEFATAFFDYLSTKSSYFRSELDNYRNALTNKCREHPEVVVAAFEAQIVAEKNQIQNVSWVKKLLFIDVMAGIGTEAQIPSLTAFEKDRSWFESTVTRVKTGGPNSANQESVDKRESTSFHSHAQEAVKRIREREK